MHCRFTIHMPPQGKRSVRFTRGGHAFMHKKTKTYMKYVGQCAKASFDGTFNGPVALYLLAVIGRPKYMLKRYQDGTYKYPRGLMYAPVTPDVDNISKCVADGMRDIWGDDRQVVDLHIVKVYAEVNGLARVEVLVRDIEESHTNHPLISADIALAEPIAR